jgi:hypothetical protein
LEFIQTEQAVNFEKARLLRQKHELGKFHFPHAVNKRRAELSLTRFGFSQPKNLRHQTAPPLHSPTESSILDLWQRDFRLYQYDRAPLGSNYQKLLIRFQLWHSKWDTPEKCILTGWHYLKAGRDCSCWFVRVMDWPPEFEVLVGIISVCPKELPEANMNVVAKRELLEEVVTKPFVYEH